MMMMVMMMRVQEHRHSLTLHESGTERKTGEGMLIGFDLTNWKVADSSNEEADIAGMPDGQSAMESVSDCSEGRG